LIVKQGKHACPDLPDKVSPLKLSQGLSFYTFITWTSYLDKLFNRYPWFFLQKVNVKIIPIVICNIYFHSMYNKTINRFSFCDIQNNQGLGKGYQPQPSALADTLDFSGYHKNLIQ